MIIADEKLEQSRSIDKSPQSVAAKAQNRRQSFSWLISKPFDWISTPMYIGAGLSVVYDRDFLGEYSVALQWWQMLLVAIATITLLGIDRYEYHCWGENTPRNAAIVLFLIRFGLVQLISFVNPNEITFFMYLIIPFMALLYFGNAVGIVTSLIVWLLFISRLVFFVSPNFMVLRPLAFINMFTICLMFIMTTAYTLKREKASRNRAEHLLLELEQSQRELEELAATRERNRLARDIHDSLGHYLTVISVLLGKAKAFREKNPAESEQSIDDARRLAHEALQDVRESVKSLRSSQELFSLEQSLPTLVAGLQSEQLKINLEIKGSEANFSKQSLMVLYRVAQESLTNIQRHSGANRVDIQLNFAPKQVQLVVEDNGKGFDPTHSVAKSGGGYGLRGIQERLEMIGGELTLDSQQGKGTRVIATVAQSSKKPS